MGNGGSPRRRAAVARNTAFEKCPRCKAPAVGPDLALVKEFGYCGDCRKRALGDPGFDVVTTISKTLAPVFERHGCTASSRQVAISILNDLTLNDLWIIKGKPEHDEMRDRMIGWAVRDLNELDEALDT